MAYPVVGAARVVTLGLNLFVFTICLLASTAAYTQDCTPNDIRLTTQAEVDSFDAAHGHCTNIVGTLWLDTGTFTSLDGLKDITGIGGDLIIQRSRVSSLSGLSNLENIGGDLEIESQLAGSFSSFSGLSSLTSLDNLIIRDTNYLTSLSGMTSLTSLVGFSLSSARVIASLAGLPADLKFKNFSISGLDQLQSLAGLPAGLELERIGISEIPQLQTLEGLSPATGIRSLSVSDNPNLTSISALAGSTFYDGYGFPVFDENVPALIIADNPMLSSLNGVPSVLPPGAFKGLIIVANPLITSLSVLDGVIDIWEEAGFFGNTALSDCSSLVKVMDEVDDGFPGPNEYTSDPSVFPPDIIIFNEDPPLGNNASGCNTIAEILGTSSEDGVFMDGFETDVTQ